MSGHPETAPSSPPPPAAAQGPPVSKHPVVKVTALPLHISRQDSVQCLDTVAFQESGGGGGGGGVEVRRSLESQKTTRIKGNGILASSADVDIDENVFAEGCKTLLAAARGDVAMMERLIDDNPSFLHFRDCDRRTALHVAASEGRLELVRWLVERGARLNRSDRWGGSALDEAHRHRQTEVASFLRRAGATTGSADQTANLMAAAAAGDLKDVSLLLQYDDGLKNESDYDRRTPLHVACSAGHFAVAAALLEAGANVNAEDRWGSTPLDDVTTTGGGTRDVVALLKEYGGRRGEALTAMGSSTRSGHHTPPFGDGGDEEGLLFGGSEDLNVDVSELQMIERIGAGAFGEIYKCRWRGTMVAAKCIKSAKIRKEWLSKQRKNSYQKQLDKEHGRQTGEDSTLSDSAKDEAIRDFRDEIAILSKVRHPNICMLLAYCTTKDHEVIVSELMRCSLLDVFRANSVHNVKLSRRTQIEYARQLARGMNYLHTCRSPIIHRDLKPANLLIDFAGTLKITDFGLAKVRPKPRRSDDGNEPRQSNENSVVDDEPFRMTGETGSYRYMAPEVFRHEPYDERVDVYSYAMVIYFVLIGHPPWPAMSGLRAVEEAAVEGRRPNLPRSWDGRWSVLLTACWKEEPAARPPFTIVVDMLDRYHEDLFGTDDGTNGGVGGGCGVGRRARGGCVVS